jgi:uncharacterized membrane protein
VCLTAGEVRKEGKNLAKAYFDNITRMPSALEFWGSVRFGKFQFYNDCNNLEIVMRVVIQK